MRNIAHFIEKDALVAEIKRRFDEYSSSILRHYDACKEAKAQELGKILTILDTLEVKEVDLEKEIRRYRMNNPIIGHREESLYDYMANAAKHFFELGLKAQKGE